MYIYERKNQKGKALAIAGVTLLLVILCGALVANQVLKDRRDQPVSQNGDDIPVLSLPGSSKAAHDEVAARPFGINAKIVLSFFDASKTEAQLEKAVSEFEGVYRPNQGVDYSFEGKVFEVMSVFSGTVVEVKDDSMFGKTVVVESADKVKITYQSLASTSVTKNQTVKQGDIVGLAGENIYNKDLGIHVHVVVQKDGKLVDPEAILGKKPAEIQ